MIIGISGKKQHGKNLLGNIIQYLIFNTKIQEKPWTYNEFMADYKLQVRYIGWEHRSFAYKLKECASIILGVPRTIFESDKGKNTVLGEEWRVWFWSHYKYPHKDSRISKLFLSKEEAEAYSVEDQTVMQYFGTASRIESKLITAREFLQLFGTEAGREIIHPNMWVNALFADYKPVEHKGRGITSKKDTTKIIVPELVSIPERLWGMDITTRDFVWYENPNWIITDTRFPNEAKAIKDREGLIFRINSDIRVFDGKPIRYNDLKHLVSNPDQYKKLEDTHISETALDNYTEFDEIITNESNIEDLIEKTRVILQKYKII